MADKIDLRLAPATETLAALIGEGAAGSFDFALIDADKELYPTYYEQALTLVRPGGVIAIDNTLWRGTVADPDRDQAEDGNLPRLQRLRPCDERVTRCCCRWATG